MIEHNIKRIPVVENGKIIGIVSRADIIRTLAQ
ncbi:CBS domain-containing protein [Desulforamulus putei]|nr:CBS domain-containing protein [Desulforamulus putei]